MNISEIITISPNIQSGEPVFTDTRVPVKNLFDYLKAGDTLEEFLNDFLSVKKTQVIELLTFFENIFNIRTAEHENNWFAANEANSLTRFLIEVDRRHRMCDPNSK